MAAIEAAKDEEDEDAPLDEEESRDAPQVSAEFRYTKDLSDEELAHRWKTAPESLGSISLGFADEGRLINAQQYPPADARGTWTVVTPDKTWGTTETIAYVRAAVERVKLLHPSAPPLRVNQISAQEGGFLPPHFSHQNGRDVDLAFYYPTAEPARAREREKVIDVALSWELLKALVILGDVQVILLDRRVQKVLYDYAVKIGEDQEWLDSLFRAGKTALVQHARRHRDHFHVRYFNPRAQELGRRVAPLLAERPEHNLMMVRVKKGDTLGALAVRHHSSVKAIQKANHLQSTFLRLAQVLRIPIHGACTQCPIPPPVEVPPRRLPKTALAAAARETAHPALARPVSLITPAEAPRYIEGLGCDLK